MPMTFVYLIGIALVGLLALIAPHYTNLAYTMTVILSIQLIPMGIFEAVHNKRLD